MSDSKKKGSSRTSQQMIIEKYGIPIPDLSSIREQSSFKYKKFKSPTVAEVKRNMEKFLSMTRMTPVGLANNIMISHATEKGMEVPDDPEQYKIERRLILNKILVLHRFPWVS